MKTRTNEKLKRVIGTRLRLARRRRGMTQAELAVILGTNQSHVSNVERGDRGITLQQLIKICRAVKISPNEILGENRQGKKDPLLIQDRRFLRRLEQIEKLPKGDKQALLKTIDAFLSKVS